LCTLLESCWLIERMSLFTAKHKRFSSTTLQQLFFRKLSIYFIRNVASVCSFWQRCPCIILFTSLVYINNNLPQLCNHIVSCISTLWNLEILKECRDVIFLIRSRTIIRLFIEKSIIIAWHDDSAGRVIYASTRVDRAIESSSGCNSLTGFPSDRLRRKPRHYLAQRARS